MVKKSLSTLIFCAISSTAYPSNSSSIGVSVDSPTQLHHVKDSNIELKASVNKVSQRDIKIRESNYYSAANVRLKNMVFGLALQQSTFDNNFFDKGFGQHNALSLLAAYTVADFVTLGIEGEFGNLNQHIFDLDSTVHYKGYYDDRSYNRYKVGVAVHQDGYELGLAYSPKYDQNALLFREEILAHGKLSISNQNDIGIIARVEPRYEGQYSYDLTVLYDHKITDALSMYSGIAYYEFNPEDEKIKSYEAKVGASYQLSGVILGAQLAYKLSDPNDNFRNPEQETFRGGVSLAANF